MIRHTQLLLVFAVFLLSSIQPARSAPAYVWLEGEAPSSANVPVNAVGWGRQSFLSEQKWLHISVEADKVGTQLPSEGAVFVYRFSIPQSNEWEIWNRIGFEFVRSPFEWRLDEGPWTRIEPEMLTTDLMEIAEWCEVAWLRIGVARLSEGMHTLSIRLPITKDDKGNPARVLYASDAICLTAGPFHPRGRLKPDDNGRTPEDEAAAAHVFQLPMPVTQGSRSSVPLEGLWEVCRQDEQLPGPDVAVPMEGLPDSPHWTAIRVPGDKNKLRPDLIFAHRLWYRTRFQVPESCSGRSFFITFPQNNLNTTVVVNGILCGFNKNPFARFDVDITKAVRPGTNELLVGIRDAYYAYSTNPRDPMKLRRKFNLPLRFFEEGFQDLAYPIWNHAQSGILFTPTLICAGAAYTTDTFVKPSVARKELAVETEVITPAGKPFAGQILCQAVDADTGQVAHTLPTQAIAVEPGGRKHIEIRGQWTDPKLWWPDSPHMYRLRITLIADGQPVDIAETPFGFREWTIDGTMFRLNGVVWRLWADLKEGDTPEEWLANYRRTNQRMQRFWGMSWMGMSPDDALDFFDRNGVVIRRSGLLDGQRIGYFAIEQDPDLRQLYGSDIKMDLMRNWRDQVVAQVKGERNHPSIMIWSIENEWLYINCINLYGDRMDAFEREVQNVADAVRAVDPTRPVMNDGGGAHKAQTMPVHGDHYVFDPNDSRYPDLAYEPNPTGGGRNRWVWDQKRPRFLGEDYYANGINPFDYAYFGGEETFEGKAASRRAAGIVARMLNEGYRWAGFAAWHFWMGEEQAVGQYTSNAPRAVLCREWNWSFGAGQNVTRTIRVYNDTQYSDPLTLEWTLEVAGKKHASERLACQVPPGDYVERKLVLPMPKHVPAGSRLPGRLVLSLYARSRLVFRDEKPLSVLGVPKLSPGVLQTECYVYDPSEVLTSRLRGLGLRVLPVASLSSLPASGRVLLVAPDTLDEAVGATTVLSAWAAAGRSVIVLEQKHPLRYQGLPVPIEHTQDEGRTAFVEDASHPLCHGLQSSDFWTWGPNICVYRNAYRKPLRGGRSLIQCHSRLTDSALLEVPAGKGVLLLCQLTVGANLSRNAVAVRLLANLLERAVSYRRRVARVTSCLGRDAQFARAVQDIGLQHTSRADPLAAISSPGSERVALIEATPQNLNQLANHPRLVQAFTDAGGWIVLHGLTPEGLSAYNRIVGFEHMIRPFRRERVKLSLPRSTLTAGLTLTDVVMYSGERIFGWTSDEYVASDIFSYCVDYRDVAPFGRMPSDYHYNIVNGMYSADAWKYIFSFDLNVDKPEFTMELPREQQIERLDWAGNAYYHLVTRIGFSTEKGQTVEFNTRPGNDEQSFDIKPPLVGRRITLRILDWAKVSKSANVVGIDNLSLYAVRPQSFLDKVRPLVNVGSLMEYRMGRGGIVLCNLLFKDQEAVPVNGEKKRRILATILANLDAPLGTGDAIIAGTNLEYQPVDISAKANQYRNERGWFGDPNRTFAALPSGRNVFGGVPFVIHEMTTSPVPTIIMLNGPGVPGNLPDNVAGIRVNARADVLFFLHTARVDRPLTEEERRNNRHVELCRYVVHYADGGTVDVPVYLDEDVAHYVQDTPRALPGAQIGWVRPYQTGGPCAVAYVKQWNNPRPNALIAALDVVYPPDRRGVPALIAVTAARRNK